MTVNSISPSPRPASASLISNSNASILAYCVASISMTAVNKYIFSGGSWNLTFFCLTVQSVVCLAAVLIGKRFGVVTTLGAYDSLKARKWLPLSVLLVGMIYSGAKSLQYLSVPVYTIFKNLTIIVIAYGENIFFGTKVSRLILVSFGLMVLSSVIAAWADIQAAINGLHSVDTSAATAQLAAGYTWMGINVFCTSAFLIGSRKVMKAFNFSDVDTMFYNNLLSIPVLVLASLFLEDWSSENVTRNFPPETRTVLIISMIYSGLGTIFISYTTAWCIRVTSSTTYSMVGALNKLPLAVTGFLFFGAPVTLGSVSAVFIAFVSGIVYAWAKVVQSEKAKLALPTTNLTAEKDMKI
ncbi:GDP-mannose transporter [Beauveria bassiana ARSEF 2860]|uniref:GDP-mannose transporter n=1 Tax=Beauveria bassiana (strain ARSEF 2860) TaxID=655819 RepID=J5JR19_BEAB2|nr:GDP-mannose transporter [Beauveria bassiana ARSEF 2860]EJP67453.1 GDP-mannose transporter [Beauveria bassiana ARSEF 2860]